MSTTEQGRSLGRLSTALLKSTTPPAPPQRSPEQIVEENDVDGAVLLAWWRTLGRRIDDAKGADATAVVLPDGSSLELTAAEKQLAQKEEARVYPPLRTAIARARAPFQRFGDRRSEWRRALVLPEPAPAAERVKLLTEFLSSTTNELEAARDVLASAGGADLDDSAGFLRGVDLPDPSSFSEAHALALVKQALQALPRSSLPGVRPVLRTPAPRDLGGVVVDDDDAVRLWTAPCLSAGRFGRLTRGAARALALASDAAAHAAGLAFCLVDADVRRAVLDDSKAAAARAARVVAATALVDARARAAAAVVVVKGYGDVDEEREVARDAVRAAVGADGGDIDVASLLLPPLPDGRVVRGAIDGVVDDATAAVTMAASYLWLRDHFDAGLLLRPRSLEPLRELPPSTADPARAWAALLSELL